MINFNSGFNSISVNLKDKIVNSILNEKIFEVGHRSNEFKDIIKKLNSAFREFLNIPKDYHVLFFQGGSSQQFATIKCFGRGAYITTGYWSNKTFKEYAPNGIEVWNDRRVPTTDVLLIPQDTDFIHYCSNETVSGLQFPEYQKFDKPVIVDCSSDLLTREINWNNVDMAYAHSQKNVGTVGVTVVIIKDSLMETEKDLENIFSYKTNQKHNSIYNTAPVFNLNVTLLAMQELLDRYTNVKNIEKIYKDFSTKVYNEIDKNPVFYNDIPNRSRSTITFFIDPNYGNFIEQIEKHFEKSMITGFKGHRSIGGYRLSITPTLLNNQTSDALTNAFSIGYSLNDNR